MFKKVLLLTCALGVTSFGSHQTHDGLDMFSEDKKSPSIGNLLFAPNPKHPWFVLRVPKNICTKNSSLPVEVWGRRVLVEGLLKSLELNSDFIEGFARKEERLFATEIVKAKLGRILQFILQHGSVHDSPEVIKGFEDFRGKKSDEVPTYIFASDHGDEAPGTYIFTFDHLDPRGIPESKDVERYKEGLGRVCRDMIQEVYNNGETGGYGPFLCDLASSLFSAESYGRSFLIWQDKELVGSEQLALLEPEKRMFEDLSEGIQKVASLSLASIAASLFRRSVYDDAAELSIFPPYGYRLREMELKSRIQEWLKKVPGGDRSVAAVRSLLAQWVECVRDLNSDTDGVRLVKGIAVDEEVYKDYCKRFIEAAKVALKGRPEVAHLTGSSDFMREVGQFEINGNGEIEYVTTIARLENNEENNDDSNATSLVPVQGESVVALPDQIKPGYLHEGALDLEKAAETGGPEGVWNFVLKMHGINRMRNLFEMAKSVKAHPNETSDERGFRLNVLQTVDRIKGLEESDFWSYGHVENPYEIVKYVGYFASLGKIFEMAGPSLSGELRELRIRMAEDGMGTLLDFTRRRVKRGEDYRYGEYVVEKKNRGKKTYQLEGDEEQLKTLTSGLARIGKEVQGGLQSLEWEVFRICKKLHEILVNNEDKNALREISKETSKEKRLREGRWGPSEEPLEEMSAGTRGKLRELMEKELWKKVFDRDDPMISLSDALDYLEHGLVSSGDGSVKSVFDLDLEDGGKGTFSIARGAVWLASNLNHVVEWANAADEAVKGEQWQMLKDEAWDDVELDLRRSKKGKDVKV